MIIDNVSSLTWVVSNTINKFKLTSNEINNLPPKTRLKAIKKNIA